MLDSVSRPDDVRDGRSCEPDRVQKLMPAVIVGRENYADIEIQSSHPASGYGYDTFADGLNTALPDFLRR